MYVGYEWPKREINLFWLCVEVKQNVSLNQEEVRLLCWTFIRCSSRHPLRRTLARWGIQFVWL